MGNKSSYKSLVYQALLFLLTYALISYRIGGLPLFESSEGRYASIARAMIDNQNWLIPYFNGHIHLSKPPITYWISAVGQILFGHNEFGAKAFLPLFATLTVLGAYHIGRLLFSNKTALLSAFILVTSLFFNIQYRGLTTDPFLVTFETWMIWALLSYILFQQNYYAIIFFILLSLGFLTKGPPVFLPLFGVIASFIITKNTKHIIDLLKNYIGWIIFIVLGLGWYIIIVFNVTNSFSYFIIEEVFKRVATNLHHREGPWYYHLVVTFGGMFPWSVFSIFAFFWLVKRIISKEHNEKELLLVMWYIIPLIILSISRSKLAPYSLPLTVPCALLTAYYLAPILSFKKEELFEFKLEVSITLFLLGVLCITLLYLSFESFFASKSIEKIIVFSAIVLIIITGFGYMFLNFEIARGVILVLGFVVPSIMIILLSSINGDEEVVKGKYLPSYAKFIKEINENYSNVNLIFAYDALHSFYFYTGKTIPIWRYKTKKENIPIPIFSKLIHPEDEIFLKEFAKNENAYILSQLSKAESIEPIIQKKLRLIKAHQKWGLYFITSEPHTN